MTRCSQGLGSNAGNWGIHQWSGSSRLSHDTSKFGRKMGPVYIGSVGNPYVDGLVVRESAVVLHDMCLSAGV